MTTTPQTGEPVEVVPAVVELWSTRKGVHAEAKTAAVTPTQLRRPGRAVLRSTWQAFVGLCFLAPVLVQVLGLDAKQLPWLAVPLAVAAGVTRIMADPRVETVLRRFPVLRWFAAAPAPPAPPSSIEG